jgi:hypothetical protein
MRFNTLLLLGSDLKYDLVSYFELSSWQVGSLIKPQLGVGRILLIRHHAGG